MTVAYKKRRGVLQLALLLLLLLFLAFSANTVAGVRRALLLCGQVILPTLFPFMVLSDLLVASPLPPLSGARLDRVSRFLFSVPAVGLLPFFFGALCGFPMGAKSAADLYRTGHLTRAEAERCLSFSNNTGPAFVIAGIGCSLFSSPVLGVILYAVQLAGALLCGILFARLSGKESQPSHARNIAKDNIAPAQKTGGSALDFPGAIRRSVEGALGVCGMVAFFSALSEIVGLFIKNKALLSFIYSFLEVGGASAMAAGLLDTMPRTAIFSACLAVSFGGLSVHMQAALFMREPGIPLGRYLAAKLTQAAISLALLCPFLLYLPIY